MNTKKIWTASNMISMVGVLLVGLPLIAAHITTGQALAEEQDIVAVSENHKDPQDTIPVFGVDGNDPIEAASPLDASLQPSLPIVAGDLAFLPAGARARLGLGTLNSLAVSSDGAYLVAGGGIGVHFYRNGAFEVIWRQLTARPVTCVVFSPDGKWVAAVSGSDITIHDSRTGEVAKTLTEAAGEVSQVKFDPEGRRLATLLGFQVNIWELSTGEKIQTSAIVDKVADMAWSPDGRQMALGRQTVTLWDLILDEEIELESDATRSVMKLSWSADGSLIGAGLSDGTLLVWDRQAGLSQITSEVHSLWVSSLDISPNGKLIASGGHLGKLVIWNADSAEPVHVLDAHVGEVIGLDFTAGGTRLVSAGMDGVIIEWDALTGESLQTYNDHAVAINSVGWSADGAWIATGDINGGIDLWNARSGDQIGSLEGHTQAVTRLVSSPDGNLMVSLSADGAALIWDIESASLLQQLEMRGGDGAEEEVFMPDGTPVSSGLEGALLDAAFSPDGSQLATGGEETSVIIWDVASGLAQQVLEGHTMPVYNVAYVANGAGLVSMSVDGTLIHWDTETGTMLERSYYVGMASAVISPDGGVMALGAWEGELELWKVEHNEPETVLVGSSDAVVRSQFSQEGGLLASGVARDLEIVNVWDVTTGRVVVSLSGHNRDVSDLAFSPEGQVLATASWDGTVLLWNLP